MAARGNPSDERGGGWIALASGSATIFLGGLGLLGWVTPWRWLSILVPKSIPMAPSTALILIALGGALLMQKRQPAPWLAIVVSAVAEGVETEPECAAVVQAGCDLLQGFLFGRPS